MKLASELTRLFVYGSLKRGLENHHVFAQAQFVGECRTVSLYRLFDLGAYLALSPGGESPVLGELYLVSEAVLRQLDAFEGVEYFRGSVTLSNGDPADAYLLADSARSRARELGADRWPTP